MVAIGISEFSFAFAFLREEVNQCAPDLVKAPILPSLVEEYNEGWDAKLEQRDGMFFFYQFKMAEYYSHPNSKFLADRTYSDPYFRIKLHRKNNNRQHRKLRQLCAEYPTSTYYIAPEFRTENNFHDSFMNQGVRECSRIISLNDCEDINDNEQHYISYQEGNTDWHQHSEPKRKAISYKGNELDKIYTNSLDKYKKSHGAHMPSNNIRDVFREVYLADKRSSGNCDEESFDKKNLDGKALLRIADYFFVKYGVITLAVYRR